MVLPTISELNNPHSIDEEVKNKLKTLHKDEINPLNFLILWTLSK